jgi:type I restriction enzyme S subunit
MAWEVRKLGDVCEISTGKSNTEDAVNDGQYAFFDRSKIIKRSTKYLFDCEAIIVAGEGQTFLPKFFTGKFDLHQRAYALYNFSNNLSIHFVFKYLIHFNKYFENVAVGATAKSLRLRHFQDLPIPIPPLAEQKRIVAILDEAFSAISTAKVNAENNLKNSKELFGSYLNNIFEKKGKDWEEKKLGEVITTLTDYHSNGSYEILKKNVELKETEDYAWMVRSTDFENDFKNDFRYINKKGYDFLEKSRIFGGEIIMSKIGNAGNVYLMPRIERPCSLAMNLFLIRIDDKKSSSEYIYQYLKSCKGDSQIKSRLLGTTTKTITKDNVRSISIPFPPLKEQQRIVVKLDALSEQTKKLEAVYAKKLADLDELKKSILQKAFRGEL